ncbi:MAG: glycosyltransferase [Acidimicrobiia bacterium]|nr:glycosyltransferase [Acidimicrobiia bacterium]
MRIYWYAPFDNASEIELAQALVGQVSDLVLHSVYSRFGVRLPKRDDELTMVRDLPAPANELFRRSTRFRRAKVALNRARFRQHEISNGDFDLVHLHTFNMFTDWIALPLLRRKGRPLVLSVHNVRPHDQRGPRAIETLVHRLAYNVPDRLIVAHESLRTRLVEEFRIAPERISVVPLPSPRVELASDHPAENPKELLFFGTLRSNKGLEVLLSAIASIPRATPIIFRIAGRGDHEIEQLIARHAQHDPRIRVEIGWITPERQATLYARAWAVVVPYLPAFAAQSGTVRVAYSFGTPVIASNTGALGETIRQDGTGWLAEPGDPRDLADRMLAAVADVEGRQARALVAKRLGQERNAETLAPLVLQLYAELGVVP